MDQCRVDAFIDLLLGNASVTTTCVIQIPFLPTPTGGQPADHGTRVASENGATGNGATEDLDAELAALARIATEQGFHAYTSTDAADPAEPCRTRVAPRVRLRWDRTDAGSRQHWEPDAKAPPANRGIPDPGPSAPTPPASGSRMPGLSDTEYAQVADAVFEGLGVIPADVLVGMCQTFGTTLTRALVDLHTGATLETADRTYKPGARLRRFITTRDQHCRFPGCTRPARLTDIDHVNRYPDGPTAAWNLQCLCRHHHRAKHEGGWRVTMTPEGTCTWTSPSGRHYTTHPGD